MSPLFGPISLVPKRKHKIIIGHNENAQDIETCFDLGEMFLKLDQTEQKKTAGVGCVCGGAHCHQAGSTNQIRQL